MSTDSAYTIVRTVATDEDFRKLVHELDAEMVIIDGDENAFYAQYNGLDKIKHAIVLYTNDLPVSCGAIKRFDPSSMEVKRMYTTPTARGQGYASAVLQELEKWTADLGLERCVLETGIRQPDAIHLYKKNGYIITPNYGQYVSIENSRCFEKILGSEKAQE